LVLIIGPSGVGKSVILQQLRAQHPELVFPKSATTREKRKGEGNDLYRFLTEEEFDRSLEQGAFIEWARVHGGARYGTLKEEIIPAIEQGKTVVREVDVQGFQSIRMNPLFTGDRAPYRLVSVFILPEDRERLIKRIKDRAPMAEDELARRLASMDHELSLAPLCDIQVLNREGKLEETLRDVEEALSK
jgi:guanylate kinase